MKGLIDYVEITQHSNLGGGMNLMVELPANAEVIGVQWQTSGGLMHQQHPCGLWLLIRDEDWSHQCA